MEKIHGGQETESSIIVMDQSYEEIHSEGSRHHKTVRIETEQTKDEQ